MDNVEYQRYCNFINKVLYELTTIEDYELVLSSLDIHKVGNGNGTIISFKSGCHNVDTTKAKPNLKLYIESRSFYCFSECCCSYNLLTLVEQRFRLLGEEKTNVQCMKYICEQVNIPFDFNVKQIEQKNTSQWKHILSRYTKKEYKEVKCYDNTILNKFDSLYHTDWIDEGISEETMDKYGIGWYHRCNCISIPVRDIKGKLVGVRGRYFNSETKYCPITALDGTLYNFPSNYIWYGLNYNKNAIQKEQKCIIFESEKSVLKCDTILGAETNFSVATFGKNVGQEKVMQIIDLGVQEIIIAIDFDYENVKCKEFENFTKDVYKIGEKFKPYCKVTALVSYGGHNLKDSPADLGKERFLDLFNNREELY